MMNSSNNEQDLETAFNHTSIPTITFNYCSSESDEFNPDKDAPSLSDSSTNTSLCSSCDDTELSKTDGGLNESRNFMEAHVRHLFDPSIQISNCDKQTFGRLCQTAEGREAFAKYVDNHRCHSMQVDESTFYKLAHCFALVLFECAEEDDFLPSKILMNMAFTYYHYPEGPSLQFKFSPEHSVELKSPNLKDFTVELSGSDGESDEKNSSKKKMSGLVKSKGVIDETNVKKQSIWKAANNWFLQATKDLSAYKPFHKTASSTKQTQSNDESGDKIRATSYKDPPAEDALKKSDDTDLQKKHSLQAPYQKRMYLYQVLRRQSIWQSLRFWNAAFFDAVNVERQNHCSKMGWKSLTPAEQESANETIRNVTFGQLGTFINNMKHLGIGQETCLQFLRKQSVIGNLNKDLYQILRSQIKEPLVYDL